jgi:hypothetical protein
VTDTDDRGTAAPGRTRSVVFEGSGVRQVRPTAIGRGTHAVPDVRRMVEAQFHVAFPHRVWVAGEVGRPAETEDGLRFPLLPSTGDDPFTLPCVVPEDGLPAVRSLLLRAHDADLEDVVREGRLARVGGLLRYDADRGAAVLLVSELDPTPTALELADARQVALTAVGEAGLGDRQRRLRVATARCRWHSSVRATTPRSRGCRSSSPPRRSTSACRCTSRRSPVPDAPEQLAGAVRAASGGTDVVLAVRERGRPLGLASYDALQVAEAVADAPVPVIAASAATGPAPRSTRSRGRPCPRRRRRSTGCSAGSRTPSTAGRAGRRRGAGGRRGRRPVPHRPARPASRPPTPPSGPGRAAPRCAGAGACSCAPPAPCSPSRW